MDKIYICAPVAGNKAVNEQAVRWLCRKALSQGFAPFAPTLFYQHLLEHESGPLRAMGMACSLAFLPHCQEIWVYGTQGMRPRMRKEMDVAKQLGIKLRLFTKG